MCNNRIYTMRMIWYQLLSIAFLGLFITDLCSGKPVDGDPFEQSCDFESGSFCTFSSWYPDVYDGQWSVVRADEGYGPSTDHTLGTAAGHYLIVNGTNDHFEAAMASIPVTAKTDSLCVSFYYMISGINKDNGEDLGEIELNLGLQVGKHVYDDQLSIVQDNTAVSTWTKHQATIRPTELSYYVLLKGRRSQNVTIAVDDVKITKNRCTEPWDNDFETGMRQFSVVTGSKWVLNTTGSLFKSALDNNSGFLHLDSDRHSVISTPMIPAWKWRQQKCIEFSYINHNAKLDVYIMLASNNSLTFSRSTRWMLRPNGKWLSVSYGYFIPPNTSYKIYFDGKTRSSDSFIALDDVYVNEVPCGHEPVVRTTPAEISG